MLSASTVTPEWKGLLLQLTVANTVVLLTVQIVLQG